MSLKLLKTKEAKIDAYNQAIGYLRSEECSYDEEGDYRKQREWLANKLDKECNKWLKGLNK